MSENEAIEKHPASKSSACWLDFCYPLSSAVAFEFVFCLTVIA